MVMLIEPIDKCISKLKKERNYDEIIYMSPDGMKLNQQTCNKLSCVKNIIILCGHYKGIDQRVRDNLITMEISIGDYVLTGGELPAAILTDGIIRLIPGVLGDSESLNNESFSSDLLEYPQYTRPRIWKNIEIPQVLNSGNHKKIDAWRKDMSKKLTKKNRPDLWEKHKKKQDIK